MPSCFSRESRQDVTSLRQAPYNQPPLAQENVPRADLQRADAVLPPGVLAAISGVFLRRISVTLPCKRPRLGHGLRDNLLQSDNTAKTREVTGVCAAAGQPMPRRSPKPSSKSPAAGLRCCAGMGCNASIPTITLRPRSPPCAPATHTTRQHLPVVVSSTPNARAGPPGRPGPHPTNLGQGPAWAPKANISIASSALSASTDSQLTVNSLINTPCR